MRLRELVTTYRAVPDSPPGPRAQILTSADAARVIGPLLAGSPVERFGVLSVDTKHRVIGWDVIAVGTVDASLIHPREVFRTGILQNAAGLVLAHNHPSGDPTPSHDDLEVTRRMIAAGELMGVPVLDHLTIADDGRYCAMRLLV